MKEEKQKILNRLKRTEGQLRGIQRMVSEEEECIDILTQLQAVRSSVDGVMGLLIAANVKQCIYNFDANSQEQEQKLAEALQLILKK